MTLTEQAFAAIRLQPILPSWLLAALAAICLLALALTFGRRARGAWLRAGVFAVMLLWLAGPRLVRETQETLTDIAVLVVDQTASMQIGGRGALRDEAVSRITEAVSHLPGLELRTIVVPENGHDGTRLFTALDRALSNIPHSRLAGVVMVTDGQIHDVPDKPQGVPLHVLLPARGEEVDRRIRIVEAPGYGIVGQSVTLRVTIDDLGIADAGALARVTIQRDGESPEVVQMPVGVEQAIEVPVTRAGPIVIELTVDALRGEVSELNNHAVVQINGVRDRLRVLLVSGEPHAGERTWRRLLKADPAVDLVHFTILRPPEKDDMTPLNELALIAFPVRELFQVKIREFDLIILDRFSNRGVLPANYLRNIADYVRNGGALLLSVGPEFNGPASLAYSPLAPVLPASPLSGSDGEVDGPFRPRVTSLGKRHPVTAGLPGDIVGQVPTWGEWYRRLQPSNTQGQALMSGPDGTPLLLLDRIGEGRAALLLSDQIWLWSRDHDGGGPQAELLRRTAHWLMKEPALEEEALNATIEDGHLTIERRTISDVAPGRVTVIAPDGTTSSLALTTASPGRSAAHTTATMPGVWQVTDGDRHSFAAAGTNNPLEISDLRASAERVGPFATASGGGVHWLEPNGVPDMRQVEPGRVASGANWIGFRRNHDHFVTGVDVIPLFPAWAALPMIAGLILAAWRREGSS